jgi:hypothetical protein
MTLTRRRLLLVGGPALLGVSSGCISPRFFSGDPPPLASTIVAENRTGTAVRVELGWRHGETNTSAARTRRKSLVVTAGDRAYVTDALRAPGTYEVTAAVKGTFVTTRVERYAAAYGGVGGGVLHLWIQPDGTYFGEVHYD